MLHTRRDAHDELLRGWLLPCRNLLEQIGLSVDSVVPRTGVFIVSANNRSETRSLLSNCGLFAEIGIFSAEPILSYRAEDIQN